MPTATALRPKTEAENVRAFDDPRYTEAWTRRNELKRKVDDIDEAIAQERDRQTQDRGTNREHAQAEALAMGLPAPEASQLPCTLAKLNEERRVHALAAEIAEQRVPALLDEISHEIIARQKPRYVDLIKRQYEVLTQLLKVTEQEDRFFREMSDGGTYWLTLQPIGFLSYDAVRHRVEEFRSRAKELYNLDLL